MVAAGKGALFPTPPFNATVWPTAAQPLSTTAEIVRVTGVSTDTLRIVRAQESSSARSIIVGDQIAATVTAKTLTDVESGFSPDLALTEMVSSVTNTIPAATSAYCCSDYELAATAYAITPAGDGRTANANWVVASPITLTGTVVLTAINVRSVIATFGVAGNMRAGVYADSSGAPGALLSQTSAKAFASTATGCRLPTSTMELTGTVWLAVQTDTTIDVDGGSAGPGLVQRSTGVTYAGGLPDPFGSADISGAPATYAFDGLVESVTELGAGAVLEIG